jgi:hypothetical protein
MTGPAAVSSLPGSRAVLGWWRDLSGLRPHRLWFAHLPLHRVELLVEAVQASPLAELGQALLGLLAHRKSSVDVPFLAEELHADSGLLSYLLSDLEHSGFIRKANTNWEVVSASTQSDSALASSGAIRRERRSFYFAAEGSPVYLPLASAASSPIVTSSPSSFDIAFLKACVERDAEWKVSHGFPRDVVRVLSLVAAPEEWLSVPLVRTEQSTLVLVEAPRGGEVLGFAVRSEGWALGKDVVLSLPGGAAILSPLLGAIDLADWKGSWQAWCHQRNVPGGEADACQLELAGHRLLVRAPARLVERLRASRSDALKGEAWLLAGNGRVRAAALIDLGECGSA